MSFNIFGNATDREIRVGYIDPEIGYVSNVTVCDANEYAMANPGTIFIFETRGGDSNPVVRYLNINEVNQLTVDDLDPSEECPGVILDSIHDSSASEFFGGGGVGAQGNPVIGSDGALLAVDVIRGGFGYQTPPLINIRDPNGLGVGAVAKSVLCEVAETEIVYDKENDFN